jgi:type IV pilus assembly protein PilB
MAGEHKQIGQILLEKRLINAVQLELALQEQKVSKEFLGAVLIKSGYVKENDLLNALSEQFKMPVVSLKNRYLDWNLVKKFSASLILEYKCFPLEAGEWSLTVAINNPLDVWALKKAEEEAPRGLKIKPVLVTQNDMAEAIKRYQEYMRSNMSGLFE